MHSLVIGIGGAIIATATFGAIVKQSTKKPEVQTKPTTSHTEKALSIRIVHERGQDPHDVEDNP